MNSITFQFAHDIRDGIFPLNVINKLSFAKAEEKPSETELKRMYEICIDTTEIQTEADLCQIVFQVGMIVQGEISLNKQYPGRSGT